MKGTLYEIELISGHEYRKIYLRATDEYHAAKILDEKIPGEINILSIRAKGVTEDGRS